MPIPFNEKTEAGLQALLDKLRGNHEAKHGPGSFAQTVAKGRVLMAKRADELTDDERALLDAPRPNEQH